MLMRGVALAALMSMAAPALAQTSGDIVMRRPLPGAKSSTSTQDGCELTNSCSTPTPTPPVTTSPTPTSDPTSGQTECPPGHVCSPPEVPTPSTPDPRSGYGWNVHCVQPDMASCELITETPGDDGYPYFDYATVDSELCTHRQSDEGNSVIADEGSHQVPGPFYDFSAMCSGGAQPTPTPTKGCNFDPALVSNQPYPGNTYGAVFQWSTDGWTGGSQCTQQSTMTRTATCLMIQQEESFPGGDGGFPVIGKVEPLRQPAGGEVMNASYSPGDFRILPGTYDASSSEARIIKAQFGGSPGTNVTVTSVAADFCSQIDPVCNSYTGPDANCGYTTTQDGHVPGTGGGGDDDGSLSWTLPDGAPGTATCSAYAQHVVANTCMSGGRQVDDRFCIDNLQTGGSYNAGYNSSIKYGNFSGCTAQWVGEPEDYGCSPDGSSANEGPTHYAYYHYQCERSDGTVLTGVDEAACTGGKPFDGVKAVGVCNKHYGLAQQYACYTTIDGQFDAEVMNTPNFSGYPSSDVIDKFCSDNGADCCAVGDGGNDNFYGYRIYAARNAQPAFEPYYNIGIYAAGTASGWTVDSPARRDPPDAPPLGGTGGNGGGEVEG